MKKLLFYSIAFLLLISAGCKKSSEDGTNSKRKVRTLKVTLYDNEGKISSVNLYGYDEQGNLLTSATSRQPDVPQTYSYSTYEYQNGKLMTLKINDAAYGKKEIRYKYDGELLREVVTEEFSFRGITNKEVYSYNSQKQKTEVRYYVYFSGETLAYTEKYTYNADGTIDVITKITGPNILNTKYLYDQKKNRVEMRTYTTNEMDFTVTYLAKIEYDDQGRVKVREVFYENKLIGQRYEESYNKDGKSSESRAFRIENGNKTPIGVTKYEYEYYK